MVNAKHNHMAYGLSRRFVTPPQGSVEEAFGRMAGFPRQAEGLRERVAMRRGKREFAPEFVDPRFLLQQVAFAKNPGQPHRSPDERVRFATFEHPVDSRVPDRHPSSRTAAACRQAPRCVPCRGGRAASVHVRIAAALDALVPAILDRAFTFLYSEETVN
jgi:hypothetical protein